ncbi:MAG TPA: amidohydrolase family protein [Peptococcaceae bacterium]|nr:amidohydrolase family protein [Peptococcaceae bacterium]
MLTVLKGATIFDGTGRDVIENGFVIINEKGKIEFVGSSYALPDSDQIKVIDVSGKFILPGLIDCHIHLDLHGMPDTYEENLVEDKLRAIRAAQEMEATLQAGFTTVRNAGSVNYIDFSVRQAIENGWLNGPRILTSGRILSITCSGTEYFAGMYRIADGYDEFKKAAREQLKEGADFLKIMATGAFMNPGGIPGAEQPDLKEIQAVVEEADKLGKYVAAHAHGAQGIKNSIRAGVRTIEHGTFADEEAIELMVENQVFLVPTFAVDYYWMKYGLEGGVPEHMLEKAEEAKGISIETTRKALQAGVQVAMGTDAGTPYNYHGGNAIELWIMVEEGLMTPQEAILSATRTAALACGIESETGTLEKGKWADLLVVEGNPLKDISILTKKENILKVFKEGKSVK